MPDERLGVAAVEAFGEPHHRREPLDRLAQRSLQLAVPVVRFLRRRLPVVARDERDDLDLLRVESAQVAVLDQIVRMAVMALVADVDADVVQQRAVLQPFPLAVGEPVHAARLIEDVQRQPRDLLRVLRPVPAPLAEFDDAAAADVGIALDLADAGAVAVDVVEHDALAQGEVAEREPIGAEPADNRVEEDRAGHREIRAARIHARRRQAFFDVRFDEVFSQAVQGLGADAKVAQIFGRLAVVGRRHQAQAEDRAGRPDHAIEALADNLVDVGAHLAVEVLDQPALVAAAQRIALDEPFGEPDDPDLEAAPERQAAAVPSVISTLPPPMSTTTAVVAADVDAVAGGQVDEARFFRAGDHADADAGLPVDLGDEVAAVVGFARRAGGAGDDLVDLVRFGDAPELGERLQRQADRGGRQAAAVEAAGAEPDHVLFAVDDLEGQIGAHLHHDHVDRVGADVDGGDAHAGRLS